MERPAYKLNAKVRTEERIYLKKEALIYSGCGSKEAHSQICDSLFAASNNEVYILDKNKLIKVSFNDEEVSTFWKTLHNDNSNTIFSRSSAKKLLSNVAENYGQNFIVVWLSMDIWSLVVKMSFLCLICLQRSKRQLIWLSLTLIYI